MTYKLYALLIGIDRYLPNQLPDGDSYSSLSGCVSDVIQVERFLQGKTTFNSKNIFKLTSSRSDRSETIEPSEPYEQWPTYENMVGAFQRLIHTPDSGDYVYIHYSGHGGRTLAKFPELKSNGLDECLVPLDIGNSEARYLRDIELAYLLNKMVEKGLIVTVVLDSCHSGGMIRGNGGVAVRGISEIDRIKRSSQSLVTSDIDLTETWKNLVQSETRTLELGRGWLPEPRGYVLLTACRPSEFAYEYLFSGKERNGALTYWLLDSFKQVSETLTYQHIHNYVAAKVHSQFPQQTPQLQGESSRVIFDNAFIQKQPAVIVMQTDLANQRILLNTGQVQAVREGTQFAIYPPSEINFSQIARRLALVEITKLGATESWAKITKKLGQTPIELGSQAILLELNNIRLYRKFRLLSQEVLPEDIDRETLFTQVQNALKKAGKGYLELVENDDTIDYQVVVNSSNEYEIWDVTGQLIPNLQPAILYSSQDAAIRLIERLMHLTKFYNILQLDNADSLSPLSGNLLFELVGVQSDYDPMDIPEPSPFKNPGNTISLKPGEWTFARIRNNSSKVLNIAVLDLQPDWGITQIYPSERDTDFWPFDPGEEILLPLEAHLPSGYTDVKDVIKVFATVGTTSFRWLELPPLDRPPVRNVNTFSQPRNAFEELLASVASSTQDKRQLNTASYPSLEWVTAQIEIQIQI